MGAKYIGRENGQYTPIAVEGTKLHAIHYEMPVASAQVKSAILLAALNAEGETVVEELETSRDHTEKMLQHFGATIAVDDKTIRLQGGQTLTRYACGGTRRYFICSILLSCWCNCS